MAKPSIIKKYNQIQIQKPHHSSSVLGRDLTKLNNILK
jgi:hypothetical protein